MLSIKRAENVTKRIDVFLCRISRYALHTTIRNRVVQGMKTKLSRKEQGVILLQGGEPAHVYSTDAEAVFRCDSAAVQSRT